MNAGAIGDRIRDGKEANMGPVHATENEAAARMGSNLFGWKVDHRYDPSPNEAFRGVVCGDLGGGLENAEGAKVDAQHKSGPPRIFERRRRKDGASPHVGCGKSLDAHGGGDGA